MDVMMSILCRHGIFNIAITSHFTFKELITVRLVFLEKYFVAEDESLHLHRNDW